MPSLTRDQFATIYDYMLCPECGAVGQPAPAVLRGGVAVVMPSYQCDTEDCEYNRDGPTSWTLVSNG